MAEGMSVKHLLSPGWCFPSCDLNGTLMFMSFSEATSKVYYALFVPVGSGGHGPLQPADPAHLGGEFLHLSVALSQREPMGVVQNQPWLPQTHPQTEDRVELKVMKKCLLILIIIIMS